jgi:hypothetical protein
LAGTLLRCGHGWRRRSLPINELRKSRNTS